MDALPTPAPTAAAAPRVGGRARAETLFALVAIAAAALWIDLGTELHRLESGDSLVPVLVSLQRWTPFYWEQDRFGMLVPLLAMPVRDPLLNLLVQRGLYLVAGQCTLLLAARWAFGAERWQLLAALGLALWLGLMPEIKTFQYMGHHPFALSLLLGLGALMVLEAEGRRAWRWPVAAALMFLAHWVNVGLFTFLVPAALARAAAAALGKAGDARRAELFRGLREAGLSVVMGLGAGQLTRLADLRAEHSVTLRFLPAAEWPTGWASLWRVLITAELNPHQLLYTCLAFGAAGAAATAFSKRWRQASWEPARIGIGLLLAGGAYSLLMGTQPHVKQNLYNSRYLEPILALCELSLLAPVVVPVARALSARAFRATCAALGALAVVGAAFTFGPPKPGEIRGTLEALSPLTPEVVSRRCTHVAGNYWKVWPAVLMANAESYRRGEDRQVWGISHRSVPTLPLAVAMPPGDFRIAVGLDDPESIAWLRRYGFPDLVLLERGDKIAVLGIAGAR